MTDEFAADTVRLDSAQLRTLAHPLRSRLLGALRVDGPATASALAQRLGSNSGKTSYHLRQLAAVGLVTEDTERGNARDRWWRAAHEFTSWSSADFRDDPDDRAADEWLSGYVARRHAAWLAEAVANRGQLSAEWLSAAAMSDVALWLTPGKLRELLAELHDVLGRYQSEQEGPAAGAERVTVLLEAFPHPEPEL